MKIRFEMEPGERKNIITMTEAFIDAIASNYEINNCANAESKEDISKNIIATMKCAQHIICAEIDRREDQFRPIFMHVSR